MLALSLASADARAWGAEGHRLIADIATRYLTPRTADRVRTLLADDRLADGTPSGRQTLREIAYWADEIKEFPQGRREAAWHFDNVPLCGPSDPALYCKSGNCASAQIERHAALLQSPRATRRQRNEALKWIVHLVADIHQPLHAATRDDRGGNQVEVAFFGQRDNPPYGTINLHTIWDIHIVQRLVRQRGGELAIVNAPIGEEERRAFESGSLASWIAESTALARSAVYSTIPVPLACGGRVREVLEVGDRYQSMAAPIVEAQIRKAGARLARVLNDLLGY